MISSRGFLIANATMIEEELAEHRNQFQKEAEQHRLACHCRKERPLLPNRVRARLGEMLIAWGERLSVSNPEHRPLANP